MTVDSSKMQAYCGLRSKNKRNETYVQSKRIARILVHSNFNHKLLRNNLAILTLTDPVKITETVDVVCLPQQFARTNTTCHVIGFGNSESERRKYSSNRGVG